ncbi:HK97 gp10 family phage protein [Anaerotruncus rubiinfantis]|uniref:HK97 gp10 family phage protein n=1 Tax=Anaerotruncus rubiinfantis TaxID=1720200 RepID=UPI00082F3F7B|nr:HK97 gp10 family phage protein [Anaerotruncus rubiinfantis]
MSENAKALADFRKKLEMLLGDFDESAKRVVVAQANHGMGVTIKNTPVGKSYPGHVGGTLKRGWKRNKYRRIGNAHVSGYSNNVEYGVYVNNGHRTVNQKGETTGWVEGRFMLDKGVNEADRKLPQLFDAEIARIKRETGF